MDQAPGEKPRRTATRKEILFCLVGCAIFALVFFGAIRAIHYLSQEPEVFKLDPPLPAEVFAEEGAPPGKPEAHYPPCLPTIQSHGFSEFWAFQFTPDSNALATSDGNSWRVWDIRT